MTAAERIPAHQQARVKSERQRFVEMQVRVVRLIPGHFRQPFLEERFLLVIQRLTRCLVAFSGSRLGQYQCRIGCPDDQVTLAPDPQTQVQILQTLSEGGGFHLAHGVEYFFAHDQAIAADRTPVLRQLQTLHITARLRRKVDERPPGQTVHAHHHACVQNSALRVENTRANDADFRALSMADHSLQPVGLINNGVRAEHQQVITTGMSRSMVLRRGFAACVRQRENLQLVTAQLAHCCKPGLRLGAFAAVVDDQHFVMRVACVAEKTVQTALQSSQLILGGNDDRHQRQRRMQVFDAIQQRQMIMVNHMLPADTRQVRRYQRFVAFDDLRQRRRDST